MVNSKQESEIIDAVLKNDMLRGKMTYLNDAIITLLPDDFFGGKRQECHRIVKSMMDEGLIDCYSKDSFNFTTLARAINESGGWKTYLESQQQEAQLGKNIKYLTYDQLHKSLAEMEQSIMERKLNIWQLKNWYWIVIFSALVGAAASKFVDYLIK